MSWPILFVTTQLMFVVLVLVEVVRQLRRIADALESD